MTTRGHFEADQFVLAAGSWSPSLVQSLRINIPILGGKGLCSHSSSVSTCP